MFKKNVLFFTMLIGYIIFSQFSVEGAEMVKETNVAGSFYSSDKVELKETIKGFIKEAVIEQKDVVGVIAPHAGYIYSGPIAGYSYKLLENQDFDLAVVLAPSHYYGFDGVSVYNGKAFETPLGDLLIDKEAVSFVVENNNYIKKDNSVFEKEHALEVQLPFLKFIKPEVKILPLLFGRGSYDVARTISATLSELSKIKKIMVIVSTDLSHYHDYESAVEIDGRLISYLEKIDSAGLMSAISSGRSEACGYMPLLTILEYFKIKNAKMNIIKYANSGDTAGDKNKVVGYLSAVGTVGSRVKGQVASEELSEEEKKTLLKIARDTLEEYLKTGDLPEFTVNSEKLKEVRGAFVTLHKNGELRGCIGNYGVEPLYQTVMNMAISAAVHDNRFPKLTLAELDEIDIEISALSPLKNVESVDDIELGKHGVIIKQGFKQGVFLPQVATETGWSKDEFLSYLCAHKAGLPADAWKDPKTKKIVFTADVFSEKDLID